MKIVFDTNVLISSLWGDSISNKLLIRLLERKDELFTSIEILNEFKRVLKRDFKYNEIMTEETIIKLLDIFRLIKPWKKIDVIKEDPADNKILECAASSKSDFILSYDNHLLKLIEFKGIKIMTPAEFIKKF